MARPLLFIHANYPGQFRHLSVMCGKDPAWEVVFLTKEGFPRRWKIPGVRILTYRQHREPKPDTHHYLRAVEEGVLRGQAVLRAVAQMLQRGFRPEVVVFHAGMGLGLFLRELLPSAKLVGYFEWYFQPELSQWLHRQYPFDRRLQVRMRNLTIEHELLLADVAIVPTAWQQSVFPEAVRERLRVLFDGIDTRFFHPPPPDTSRAIELPLLEQEHRLRISSEQLVLSYATRGMEPLRGFPEFMRMLPHLLPAMPQLQVVIAGDDRQAYSFAASSHEGSWKQALLAELGNFPGRERLHFVGSLVYADYRRLLWRSDLHCYFTRPYVTSWSLFEAAACGTPLCLNPNPATALFSEQARLRVDLDAPSAEIAAAIRSELERPSEAQRITGLGQPFQLEGCLKDWKRLLLSLR